VLFVALCFLAFLWYFGCLVFVWFCFSEGLFGVVRGFVVLSVLFCGVFLWNCGFPSLGVWCNLVVFGFDV